MMAVVRAKVTTMMMMMMMMRRRRRRMRMRMRWGMTRVGSTRPPSVMAAAFKCSERL